ncbi:galactokinase [Chthonomonas calidirosea]|uniref:Galactokinase n=1 Tax=Chthonomonas calidirosea (strain DSM 23976 / ICMP 18418 / T49) TaxID=1303518 RepID=S0EV27_CHTCT|nr:galactokinase [Chthonomonas calidirosea]CCW35593.1 galactokinase [Chthonomonas calidirosea T49]CEK18814.1 galactokinase [Chthonomonas calidirosea]CEK19808.1 galactokinase [Chthonomonas calidirosea]
MQQASANRVERLVQQFKELYGVAPELMVRAPGRVNLIGEHTDYNEGYVFPAAIERDILIAASVRPDKQVRLFSLDMGLSATFTLDAIEKASIEEERWSNYPRAMAWALQNKGFSLRGVQAVLQGDIPPGAGLSSSAALLVACGLLLLAAAHQTLDLVELALLAQQAEREFVGVNVGIMDQFISALGQKDHALFIDTRTLHYEAVPLPTSGVFLVIANTNKPRGLVDSAYNQRRAECEEALDCLRRFLPSIRALRDVTLEEFTRWEARLPEVPRKRARHVITENERVLQSVDALKRGDIALFGSLMNASHRSLRDDYEVSCTELDALVEAAWALPGVYGSRMTGAGFGGCTVSLVAEEALERFCKEVPERYQETTGREASILITRAAQGAERIL